MLDAFCGPKHAKALVAFGDAHARAAELRRELEELRGLAGARERDLDLLVFEIEEIAALEPSEADEAELLTERERLRHLEALRAASGGAAEALSPEDSEAPGACWLLSEAERLAGGVAGVDPALDALLERVRGLRIEADDAAAELRRYEGALEDEPGRLEEVEQRLELYERLKRKHGGSVRAMLEHAERCRSERERLDNAEVALEAAEAALAEASRAEAEGAAALRKARRTAAPRLEKRVLEELAVLALEDASFRVELEPRERLGASGGDRAELHLAPNPGVPAAPLRETASGGELSRVMLALMSVATADGGAPTVVFDEVDAGIGGQTARAVGDRLRRLGGERQVLCITHLPQIASLAQRHFRIEKDITRDVASATVERLEDEGVVEELCRMLGAESSDAGARRHAEELLAAA